MNALQGVTLPVLTTQMHKPLSMCYINLHGHIQFDKQAAEGLKGVD